MPNSGLALFTDHTDYTMGTSPMAFIACDTPTVTMTADNSRAAFVSDTNAVVLLGASTGRPIHGVSLLVAGGVGGIMNVDYFNSTDHISLTGSGFANPAAAAKALSIGHFGEVLRLPSGGQINFNEPAALLTAANFTHV